MLNWPLRIVDRENEGLPILGAIAAGGLVEPFTDITETLDLPSLFRQSKYYALRVVGDSMSEDLIAEGDLAILREVSRGEVLKDGEIVAARVEGLGTTLKRIYHHEDRVTLAASNPKYAPIEVSPELVVVQGILVGVWRGYHPTWSKEIKS